MATLLTAVACLTAGCSSASGGTEHKPKPKPVLVQVTFEGRSVAARIEPGTTIAAAIGRLHLGPTTGRLLSVHRHRPLRTNHHAPILRLDGRVVRPDERIEARAALVITRGSDTTEGTVTRREVIEPTGLPNALQYVQYGGRAGTGEITRGQVSGEIVSTKVIQAAIPAHRATGKVVALTFDDGPDPRYTDAILAILKAKHVPAAFCEIGFEARDHPQLTKDVIHAHRQLCNHTLDHVEGLATQPLARVRAEITGGRDALHAISHAAPTYYRPPGGSLGPVVYQVAGEVQEPVLFWSIDPRDWKRPSVPDLISRVISGLKPGGIILLHDGGGNRSNTVAALPAIIDLARALGYTFTLPITTRHEVG